jgi:hypothetical protein
MVGACFLMERLVRGYSHLCFQAFAVLVIGAALLSKHSVLRLPFAEFVAGGAMQALTGDVVSSSLSALLACRQN